MPPSHATKSSSPRTLWLIGLVVTCLTLGVLIAYAPPVTNAAPHMQGGTLTFTPIPTVPVNGIFTELDQINNDGLGSARVRIDSAGNPVAFYVYGRGSLTRLIRCADPTCTNRTVSEVPLPAGPLGPRDMQLDSQDRPVFFYQDFSSRIGIARCSDPNCTSLTTASFAGEIMRAFHGRLLSINSADIPIALFQMDNPFPATGMTLNLMRCTTPACTAVTRQVIPGGTFESQSNLALDSNDVPLISFRQQLWRCESSTTCASPTVLQASFPEFGPSLDMVLDAQDRPLILFQNPGRYRLVECADANCSSFSARSIFDEVFGIHGEASIVIAPTGERIIAFSWSNANALQPPGRDYKYLGLARCDSARCTYRLISLIDDSSILRFTLSGLSNVLLTGNRLQVLYREVRGSETINRLMLYTEDLTMVEATPTASSTPLPTLTPTPTNTFTPTPSATPTNTFTATFTPSITPSATATFTPSITPSPTETPSPTATYTPTNTWTPTSTWTPSLTYTPSATFTPSRTPTITPSSPPNAAPHRNRYTTDSVTLRWSAVMNATSYHVQMAFNPGFQPLWFDAPGIGGETAFIDGLQSGVYYWRVRAEYSDGHAGPWSQVDSFIVELQPTPQG